jgi:hypothetical protein
MLYEGEMRAGFFKVGGASVGWKERAVMSNFGGVDSVVLLVVLLLAGDFCVLAARAAAMAIAMLQENCLNCIRGRQTRRLDCSIP